MDLIASLYPFDNRKAQAESRQVIVKRHTKQSNGLHQVLLDNMFAGNFACQIFNCKKNDKQGLLIY